MNDPFGAAYAAAYDALYRAKDYAAECDLLERVFSGVPGVTVRSVLDLGCGTGGHALELARRGYEVDGVDRSPDMLACARQKLAAANVTVGLHRADLREYELGRGFDAAIMMFAVLGYQTATADVVAVLRTARRHLQPGGLLAFDIWYGPAVLHQRPGERTRVVDTEAGQVQRLAHSELDTRRQVCTVTYRLAHLGQGERAETVEEHRMRFFFPLELELLLQLAGFEALQLRSFPAIEEEPSEQSWNVLVVARATAA